VTTETVSHRLRDVDRRVWNAWVADESIGLRQVPVTLAVTAVVVILFATVEPREPALLVAGVVVVVGVQLVGSLGHWDQWPRRWLYALPCGQIVAIGLVDIGVGQPLVGLDTLLLLPVTSLALGPGAAGLGLALCGSVFVLFAPTVLDIGRAHPLLSAVVTTLLIGAVAIGAHGIVGMARRQATELEQARDELADRLQQLRDSRAILQSVWVAATEQAFIATDADGVILSASTGTERIFGRSRDELAGSDVTRLLAPEDAAGGQGAALPQLVGSAAEGGTHVREWQQALPDGTVRPLEVVVTPRPPLEGSNPELPAGYLLVATDLTARYEEERMQDEFIGLVSHELRTPLASILGYLELIRMDGHGADDTLNDYLDVVERNANRLRTLVDDLLASAQVAVGMATAPEELDVVDVVRTSAASQRPMADAQGVAIEVAGEPTVLLVSDGVRLGQVVDNLLSNAVKYSLAGGRVVVTVTADATPDGVREARIRVVDEGTGIERDELSRLTERFYRTRDTRRRRVRGVGLGLALVQTIVDEHGGTLTIDSEPGEGTTVEVVLPDLAARAGATTPGAG